MDHSSGRVALFNITGFVTDCCLTVDGVQSSRAGPRCSMQSITVTGLNDTVFRDAVNAANLVSDFMLGAGPHITPLPSVVTLAGSVEASQQWLELCENWVNGGDGNQRFVYTADNDIEVMNLIGLENDSDTWEFQNNVSRSMIQPGNLIEIIVSFRVAPFAKGVKKVQCHLHRVLKISSEATSSLRRVDEEAAAVRSAEGQSSGQLLGKRSLPAPFARTTRLRMDVDQLSSDVQNLGVNSH
ncbi:hypothetical protein B0H14DRAFT_2617128 [Mycena olivaceomarginata]|nr:hypothetical protein B0H14DRAFT_2617128 [Mycena olivaceomarginata]